MSGEERALKELRIAKAKAALWEFCYMLETGQWHLEDFNPETIERLRLLLILHGASDDR